MTDSAEDLKNELAALQERVTQLEGQADHALRSLATFVPDNIMLLDADGNIRFINWTVPDLTVEQVIGTPPWSYVPPAFRQRIKSCLEHVRHTREPGRYETEYMADSGAVSRWEARVAPVLSGDEVTGFALVASNVTEREEANAERHRFFDLSMDMLCVASFDGYFRRVNPSFEKTLGWSSTEITARPFIDFVHDEDREATEAAVERLLAGEEITDFENRYRCKDGGFRLIQWRATGLPQLKLIYAAGRDVTQRHTLMAQLLQSQKMDAIGQLAGGVAHDFNNLLLAILINSDLALRAMPNEAQEPLREIKMAGLRAADLTRQLLAFSRQQPMHTEALDVNELTTNLMAMLRRIIPKSIALDFIPGHALPRVHADRGQVEQVILNLCINARDAMPGGGRITLESETVVVNGGYRKSHPWARPGRYVLLTVTDTGTGMSTEVRERIFDPFFTTKEPGTGTGLGLATVYGIVERHGGMVQVYSELGHGTTFKVYLPVGERAAESVGSKIAEPVRGGRETILVAEDADAVRRVVVHVLQDAGYQVLAASHGDEAVALLNEHGDDVALALLDVVMPGRSGPEVFDFLATRHPNMPVVLTSGYSDMANFGDERLPPDRVLQKPYEPDDLLRLVRRVIDDA